MLRKEELTKIAEAKGLSLQYTERDYLLEAVLFSLYKKIRNELVFKGGTALYKFYGLNRFSEDLDFTLVKHRSAINVLIQKAAEQLSLLGIEAKMKNFREFRHQINACLECRGPLYNGSKETLTIIPLNISLREKVHTASYEMVFSPYREIPSFEVYVMGEAEIAVEKIRAILNRDKARDVYDLWFLLKKGIKLDKTMLGKKAKSMNLTFELRRLNTAILAKQKMWEMDLQKLTLGTAPSFDKVYSELKIFLGLK